MNIVNKNGQKAKKSLKKIYGAEKSALRAVCSYIPILWMLLASDVATAQETETQNSPKEGAKIEQIVVTATRVSRDIQKVPVAVTAFSAGQIAERTIVKETDLQSLVPGLTVKTGVQGDQLYYAIRGQTLDAFTGSSPGVLSYVNDVQVSTTTSQAFYDLESVQVLKGPQGTLFGRNAVGGAVLYNTQRPSFNLDGFVTARIGDYGLKEVQGAITIPIVADKAALRLAEDVTYQDGYIRNVLKGTDIGTRHDASGRISLLLKPTDDLTNTTVVQYGLYGGTALNPELFSVYPLGATNGGVPLNGTAAALYPGPNGIVAFLGKQQQQLGPYKEELNYTPLRRSHTFYAENTTTYGIMPDLQIKNIIGTTDSVSREDVSTSGAPFASLDGFVPSNPYTGDEFHTAQWSEELQLVGSNAFDGQFKYIVGLYASSETDQVLEPINIGWDLPGGPIAAFIYHFSDRDRSQAGYFQGTYDMAKLTSIDGLSVTVGGRYSFEQLSLSQLQGGLLYGLPANSDHERSPSWHLGVEYQATPDVLIYAVNRGSWRSGNFNGNENPINNGNHFGPEHTIDFELGAKTKETVLDHKALLNVAFYNQHARDVQRDVYYSVAGNPASLLVNVPAANVQGVEFDATVILTDWLKLGANGAYTFAHYTQPTVMVNGQSIPFNSYSDTPRWAGSVYCTLYLPVPETLGEMTIHADVYGQQHQYFTSLNETLEPGTKLPGYGLVNLRYDWADIGGSNASFAFYVKNLLNRPYYLGGFPAGAINGVNSVVPGAPRMVGAEFSYKF